MKKFAMLILLGMFATASVSACSKDKKDDKAGDKKDDKAKDDKKGDTAAKGADNKAKDDSAATKTAERKVAADDEGDDQDPGTPEEAKDGEKKAAAGDTSFDDAFVKEANEAFEGFVKIMEANKDDCPKMAKELDAYMGKFGHIKDKVDAIEADPDQKAKWKAATGESDKALEARMMPALEGCMEDPAMEAVFSKM